MVTDSDLAQVCHDLYHNPSALDHLLDARGVVAGIRNIGDDSIICFRGSTTFLDWVRDFQAQMVFDRELGWVECGFIQGLREIAGPRVGTPKNKIYITGHSLGAARALLFAAFETLHGLEIERVTVFGAPRPGGARVREILAPVDVRCYRNRADPVCAVPLDIPLLDAYTQVRDVLMLDVPPAADDAWGIFADHHMDLYLTGVRAYEAAARSALA